MANIENGGSPSLKGVANAIPGRCTNEEYTQTAVAKKPTETPVVPTETQQPPATETEVKYTSTVPVSTAEAGTPTSTSTKTFETQPSVTPGQSEPLVVSGANAAKTDVVGYGALVLGGAVVASAIARGVKHYISSKK